MNTGSVSFSCIIKMASNTFDGKMLTLVPKSSKNVEWTLPSHSTPYLSQKQIVADEKKMRKCTQADSYSSLFRSDAPTSSNGFYILFRARSIGLEHSNDGRQNGWRREHIIVHWDFRFTIGYNRVTEKGGLRLCLSGAIRAGDPGIIQIQVLSRLSIQISFLLLLSRIWKK